MVCGNFPLRSERVRRKYALIQVCGSARIPQHHIQIIPRLSNIALQRQAMRPEQTFRRTCMVQRRGQQCQTGLEMLGL